MKAEEAEKLVFGFGGGCAQLRDLSMTQEGTGEKLLKLNLCPVQPFKLCINKNCEIMRAQLLHYLSSSKEKVKPEKWLTSSLCSA